MIKLYEYYLSPDGENLVLQVMPNTEEYTNCRLVTVRLSTSGDFGSTDASAKAFDDYFSMLETEGEIVIADGFRVVIKLSEVLPCNDINHPYYLHVTAAADSETCTTVKELYSITFNKYPLYKAVSCAANLMEGCEPPQILVDSLLRLKVLEAAVALGIENRDTINYYYDWFLNHASNSYKGSPRRLSGNIKSPCGCGK